VRPTKTLAALLAVSLLAAGCGRSGTGGEEGTEEAAGPASTTFGDLKAICGPGNPKSAPTQGVTADSIEIGVFTDIGFSKKSEYVDTAKVFTSWCNELGGINGRKVVANTRDTKMVEVRQRMLESCREDFAIVGGSAGLDALGVKDRLSCLLPAFPAQASQLENNGSELQITQLGGASYNRYQGYFHWLLNEAYPGSKGKVGFISGDSPVTKVLAAQYSEGIRAAGGAVVYNDYYPSQGVSDWTPYAQALKSKDVKGLIFLGDFRSLAKLEQVLTSIGHKPDWIDANNNAYGAEFIKLAGSTLSAQNNLADLNGVHPLENAAANPATKQLLELFERYAPGKSVTLPAVRGFSAWLLFAKAAASCGDALTRKCMFEAALKEASWTGGGLHAPIDASKSDVPMDCFNIVQATPAGWRQADFKPNKGAYRCGAPVYKFTGKYAKPLTLADVGKSMSDLK
jgi:hypothetical protein